MVKYNSSAITIKNSKDINKPNEDYYLCDDEKGIYILVDGVSRDKIKGVYPNPSPSFLVSKIFVESVYKFLLNSFSADIFGLLYDAIKKGNDEIKNYNDKIKWENGFLPGTVGIIVIIRDDKLFYAYIGDCYGFIVNSDKHIFSKCQTENIAKHKKEFSAFEIRNKICNNVNHPYSYGVFNGDIRAMKFVNYGDIDVHEKDKIFLCSDGFSDIVKNFSGEKIYKMEIGEIIKNSKECDDKTMIIIEGKTYEKENL